MRELTKEEIIKMIGFELYKKIIKKTDLEFVECGEVLDSKLITIMINNKYINTVNSTRIQTFFKGYICALDMLGDEK